MQFCVQKGYWLHRCRTKRFLSIFVNLNSNAAIYHLFIVGCRVCEDGWIMDPANGGCIDVDECATTKHKCTLNQFCVNSDGSYKCIDCDKSCSGCSGDGPDLCYKCADGFELRDGICKGWYCTIEMQLSLHEQ